MSNPLGSDNPFSQVGQAALKDTLERSVAALHELNSATQHNLQAMVASMQKAQTGAETVRQQTVAYCQRMADEAATAARAITSAKNPAEAFQVQAEYSRKWFEGYLSAVREISQTMGASVQATLQPIKEAEAKPSRSPPGHPEGGSEA